jgi:hypothetical protein
MSEEVPTMFGCRNKTTSSSYIYKKKVKQSRYRPGVALRVPGS